MDACMDAATAVLTQPTIVVLKIATARQNFYFISCKDAMYWATAVRSSTQYINIQSLFKLEYNSTQ